MTYFTPQIIAFCCEYCGYAAADLAGSLRLSYPSSIKVVRVPCTGRVDIIHILKAFEGGADGAYVVGCLEGNCHFLEGNSRARKRVEYAKILLDECGTGGERIAMFNMSSAQGLRFAEVAKEMAARITALGPNPMKRGSGEEAGLLAVAEQALTQHNPAL